MMPEWSTGARESIQALSRPGTFALAGPVQQRGLGCSSPRCPRSPPPERQALATRRTTFQTFRPVLGTAVWLLASLSRPSTTLSSEPNS